MYRCLRMVDLVVCLKKGFKFSFFFYANNAWFQSSSLNLLHEVFFTNIKMIHKKELNS